MRTRPHLYVLDADGNPLAIDDVRIWAAWFETGERRVRQTQIGPYVVSTVFLGLDHAWDGPPLIFETMVFAGERGGIALWTDLDCRRYPTRDAAIDGHQITCDLVAIEVERQEGARPVRTDVAI